jgi:hypothetical protein
MMMIPCNTRVKISRLGDDKEYYGKVVGLAVSLPEFSSYIVEPDDIKAFKPTYEYTHFVITESCLDVVNE